MLRALRNSALAAGFSALPLVFSADALAATPTPAQALALMPMQADVSIDQPLKEEVANCKLDAEKSPGISGWVLVTAGGRTLRRFLDTNDDNKVDQWCYYKDGVEVYRDIDSNKNGKADQYRWLGTAGVRWGLDVDEDGRIDSWKMISAEEATAEIIAAFRDKDPTRFERLLLTPGELKALGLGDERAKDVSAKVSAATTEFKNLVRQQAVIGPKSQWVHFGGTQPGILPAGVEGSTKDVVVYDNVSAVVETDGKHAQIAIGSLVRVGDTWRIIDVPSNLLDTKADAAPPEGFFYARPGKDPVSPASSEGLSPETQKLITELGQLDKSLLTSTPAQQGKLHSRRCDVLEGLISKAKPGEDKSNWIRQYADTVAAAVQAGVFAEGAQRLDALAAEVARSIDKDVAAYVKFRAMTAGYNLSLQPRADYKPDYAKIQVQWLDELEKFVNDFPRSPDAAEAMLQLALAQESAGKEEAANGWYSRIVGEFPTTAIAKKATGAKRRLACVGKSIELRGKSIEGQAVDLTALRGKVVLIHYWATWCEPCKADMADLKRIQAKFATARKPLQIIGVTLDTNGADAANYLKTNRYPWPQVWEEGGLEGRLATDLGIWTLTTMILVDKDGKVLNRDIHIGEVEVELEKQLK